MVTDMWIMWRYFPEVSLLLVVSLLFYQSWCDNQNAGPCDALFPKRKVRSNQSHYNMNSILSVLPYITQEGIQLVFAVVQRCFFFLKMFLIGWKTKDWEPAGYWYCWECHPRPSWVESWPRVARCRYVGTRNTWEEVKRKNQRGNRNVPLLYEFLCSQHN